jgi:hypothetical protein
MSAPKTQPSATKPSAPSNGPAAPPEPELVIEVLEDRIAPRLTGTLRAERAGSGL